MQSNINVLKNAIEHTILKPESTSADIIRICKEAMEHKFFGVCVNSCFITLAKKTLQGSAVKVVAVVGFPLGAMETSSKAFEARRAVELGADEIDMVINIGSLKERNLAYLKEDIASVVHAAQGHPVKVIIETALLTQEEKILACEAAVNAQAHFVKTSTGFSGGGATIEDIQLMRKTVGSKMGVKASGGVKTTEQALALLSAGANRLGTSSGVALLKQEAVVPGTY